MRREGSPWQGLWAVTAKELADHLSSSRMRLLEWLIVLTAAASLYGVFQAIHRLGATDDFLFLRLFTLGQTPMPSFAALLGFLIPLVAIGLGFDAINGEYSRRTMSRLLSQPLYRDALIMGKFLAGLGTMAISLVVLWLLLIGAGVLGLGVAPNAQELMRLSVFLVLALAYSGIWLAVAILCSILFRSAATSALACLGLWLFLILLWPMLAPALAQIIAPPDPLASLFGQPTLETLRWEQALSRLSPAQLFNEGVLVLLNPETRSLGPVFVTQLEGALVGAPLPLGTSLSIIWPQAVGLLAGMILLFTVGYVAFQRQEVRA